MTYCVGFHLNEGLVFLADSRTNAGIDHIATFRKLYTFNVPGERVLVLLSSGNLATTQNVINALRQSVHEEQDNIHLVATLFEVADIVGRLTRQQVADFSSEESDVNFGAHFILGGQIAGQEPMLFHIYPEGNFIHATRETPYFQIGESKYGKPILDRIITSESSLDDATKCALISMDSTLRSNLSVGLPLDLVRYRRDSLEIGEHHQIDQGHEGFSALRSAWSEGLNSQFRQLPDVLLGQ